MHHHRGSNTRRKRFELNLAIRLIQVFLLFIESVLDENAFQEVFKGAFLRVVSFVNLGKRSKQSFLYTTNRQSFNSLL